MVTFPLYSLYSLFFGGGDYITFRPSKTVFRPDILGWYTVFGAESNDIEWDMPTVPIIMDVF